jgi:hypothetical protein
MHKIGGIKLERFKDRHADIYKAFVEAWQNYCRYVMAMEEQNPDGVAQIKPAKHKADLEVLEVKAGFPTLPPKPTLGEKGYPEKGTVMVKLVRSYLSLNYGMWCTNFCRL